MGKTRVLLLVKANPSPFAKEVIYYQEEQILQSINLTNTTICGIYRFISKELNYKAYKETCIIQRIRTRSIDQVIVISKSIISSDISVCNDFESFCNHYGIVLVEISSLHKLIDKINQVEEKGYEL